MMAAISSLVAGSQGHIMRKFARTSIVAGLGSFTSSRKNFGQRLSKPKFQLWLRVSITRWLHWMQIVTSC